MQDTFESAVEIDYSSLIRELTDRVSMLESKLERLQARKAAWAGGGIDSPRPITADDIIKAVSEWEGVLVSEIRGRSRLRRIARARFIAAYIIREVIGMSLQDTANQFSYNDHGSVANAVKQVEKEMQVNSNLREAVTGYIEKIKNPAAAISHDGAALDGGLKP